MSAPAPVVRPAAPSVLRIPGMPHGPARWALLAAAAAAATAGAAWLYANDPSASGVLPPCPSLAATGLFCPGCGSARCLHALLHGDVATAFDWNPLVVLLLPLLAIGLFAEARAFVRPGTRRVRLPRWGGVLLLAAIAAFAVARNLPFAPFTALAPR